MGAPTGIWDILADWAYMVVEKKNPGTFCLNECPY
jgi:hypothetical protein